MRCQFSIDAERRLLSINITVLLLLNCPSRRGPKAHRNLFTHRSFCNPSSSLSEHTRYLKTSSPAPSILSNASKAYLAFNTSTTIFKTKITMSAALAFGPLLRRFSPLQLQSATSQPLQHTLLSTILPALAIPILTIPSWKQIWDGILLAVPKKRQTHSKGRKRRHATGAAQKDLTSLNRCSACGRVKRMHILCTHCVMSTSLSCVSGRLGTTSCDSGCSD